MFIPSIFKSVTPYLNQVAGSPYLDVAITSVDSRYTMLVWAGNLSTDASGFPDGGGLNRVILLNDTTVRIYTQTFSGYCSFTVCEFYPGFLRQAVQYGTVALGSGTSGSIGITTVGSKAFIMYLGITENIISAQTDMASVTGAVYLSGTTIVGGQRIGSGGASAPDDANISFCVVDPR